jgi:ubiquinone/menaquinone biosynthesis C-methylase UbiE
MAVQDVSMFEKIWSQGNYHKLAVEHQSVSEQLVAEAGVRAGQKVLDLACGSGNTAIAAARRRARVTATDVVPAMLDVTRRRVEAEELDGVEYHVGESSPTIPFADETFDVVLSTFGASFFPDHQRVIDEMLRITRPGGTIGVALWSEAGLASDFFRAGQALNKTTEIDKIQPAYQLGNGDYLREKLKGRSSSLRIVPSFFEACYLSLDQYVETHISYHPPAILRLSGYSAEQRQEYKQMLRTIAQRYNRATDGTLAICLDYLMIIIVKA